MADDPKLPMDTPERREVKQGDYCLDLSIERGPHMSIRMSKLQARAALAAINKSMEGNAETAVIRIEHDGGETILNGDAVLVATIRPYEEPVEHMLSHEGAAVIGMIGGRRPRPN